VQTEVTQVAKNNMAYALVLSYVAEGWDAKFLTYIQKCVPCFIITGNTDSRGSVDGIPMINCKQRDCIYSLAFGRGNSLGNAGTLTSVQTLAWHYLAFKILRGSLSCSKFRNIRLNNVALATRHLSSVGS